MMLAIENPETGTIGIAMLLDEPPSREYMPGGMGGEPYRRNGPLVRALREADMYGHAWLTVVHRGDEVRTWGSKQIKVECGGRMYTPERTKLGNETGELKELRYETVCPTLFSPKYGIPTTLNYKVLLEAEMTSNPVFDAGLQEKHELFGYKEPNTINVLKEVSEGPIIHPHSGCRVVWLNQAGNSETWFLEGYVGFEEYRFELTEHQRRPFVRQVLKRLGWIRQSPETRTQIDEIEIRQFRAHMLNVSFSIRAVSSLLSEISRNHTKAYDPSVERRSSRPQPPAPTQLPQADEVVPQSSSSVQQVPLSGIAATKSNNAKPEQKSQSEDEEATGLTAADAYNEMDIEEPKEVSDHMQIVVKSEKRTKYDTVDDKDDNIDDDSEEFVFDG